MCTFSFHSNPRLDIRWSRLHAPIHGHSHRGHHARMNHMENVRLLNQSPLIPADYQYQASSDQTDLNLVSTNNRNHRKRHAQQKKHNRGYSNESQRMRRSLQNNKRNQAKRKIIINFVWEIFELSFLFFFSKRKNHI